MATSTDTASQKLRQQWCGLQKISERDLTGGRGREVTRRPVLMWSQEVCHNLQTDLSPEAPPPTDGASAQPMLRPPGDGRLGGYRRDQKDSHSPSSKQVGRKVEQRRGGLRFKKKKKKKRGEDKMCAEEDLRRNSGSPPGAHLVRARTCLGVDEETGRISRINLSETTQCEDDYFLKGSHPRF